jgi:creatinine amidohydrolase
VMGDATAASLEKGDRLLASVADGWVRLLEDVYKFRQPNVNK